MTKARVLHVITRLDLGGAQENTLYCVRHHDRTRYEVGLLAGAGGILDDDARAIPDATVMLVPWLHHEISPFADADAVVKMARAFRHFRAAVVHLHSSKAGLIGRLAGRLANVPVVVHTAHGWSFNDAQRPLVRALFTSMERIVAPLASHIVTVSERDRVRALDEKIVADASRISVVRSGIDVSKFARTTSTASTRTSLCAALGLPADAAIIGTVACLKPQKAPLDVVEVAARVVQKFPGAHFVIAGDGELRGEMERLIVDRGLSTNVHLLGWRKDVDTLYPAFDVFLLTSLHEGLPRAVLEASAAGVPVVATAIDGIPEVVVDGRNGFLFAPGDIGAASGHVIRILGDDRLQRDMGCAATAAINEEFSIGHMLKQLEARYERLLVGD